MWVCLNKCAENKANRKTSSFLSESRHAPQSFLLILRKLESVNMTRLLYKKKKLADGQTAERYLVKLANTYSNEAKLKF